MTPQLRYAVEPATRVVRGKVYTRYRWVQYRATNDHDGRPVYLRKTAAKRTDRSRAVCQGNGLRSLLNYPRHWGVTSDEIGEYLLTDAKDGEPVTERDALKFLPEMTHGMAALDKLRDLLSES